ncbi:MAG TPA: 1,4-alpha-glucan branching protein domain-containing protein, partial [Rhodospirillales bacterium]|nr:1,4-alpha-glucan branching protein domain-containing protein [Rhodospirillales bacterium]
MARGYLALVLHAHLPFVRHPEYESFLEETWLFEAITDTYVPLLRVFEGLVADGIPFRMTVSISPPLIAMLRDPFLQERYLAHLGKMEALADKEILRTHGNPQVLDVARMYRRLLYETREYYVETCGGDLIGAFRRLQDAGVLEIATASATHGFLPILKTQPSAVRAQLQVAGDVYRETFGRQVPGFWLPECGYYPGLEELVAETGGRFFFVDTHAVMNAESKPRFGYLAPLGCGDGTAAFGRDPATSRLVWSADEGYPGDPWYRDFYRDIGFDLDFEYIRPFILDGHTRVFTGFKYHRITGRTDDKALYDPATARQRANDHAEDFLKRQMQMVERCAPFMDRPPVITALYDAELFGHWWFEGPQWLDYLIRKLVCDQKTVELITPGQYLARHGTPQQTRPSASSWGDKGYSSFWLNPGNDWIYRHLHDAAGRMQALARTHAEVARRSLAERALTQAGRSLLLAQASDWPFIMKTGTNVEYAHGRVRDHLARFHTLADDVERDTIDAERLAALETMDSIFPGLDFRVW